MMKEVDKHLSNFAPVDKVPCSHPDDREIRLLIAECLRMLRLSLPVAGDQSID